MRRMHEHGSEPSVWESSFRQSFFRTTVKPAEVDPKVGDQVIPKPDSDPGSLQGLWFGSKRLWYQVVAAIFRLHVSVSLLPLRELNRFPLELLVGDHAQQMG